MPIVTIAIDRIVELPTQIANNGAVQAPDGAAAGTFEYIVGVIIIANQMP